MKPYFAKYLPVEGEIKEGDIFLGKGELLRRIPEKHQATGCIAGIPKDQPMGFIWHCTPEQTKAVKLFLCSRDIQVGDEYTCPNKGKGIDVGFGQPPQVKVFMIYTKERNLCPDCYKIIGEISPEATISDDQELSQLEVDGLKFNNWLI